MYQHRTVCFSNIFNSGATVVKTRIDADKVAELWEELGPAGGAATPHIPAETVPDTLAVFANASTAATVEAWFKPFWQPPVLVPLPEHRSSTH